MQLFKISRNSTLNQVDRVPFKDEHKDIQVLVEANMERLFDLEFVSSEFTVGGFRLDSLAFDENSNSFVIVEYKKRVNFGVVDQGYSYLSTMLNNKAEFIVEYSEKKEVNLKKSDVDWESSRVIFISPHFNAHQINSINFSNVPFQLWEIRKFESDLLVLEQRKPTSNEKLPKPKGKGKESNNEIAKVSSEVKSFSIQGHVSNLDDSMKAKWEELKLKLEEFSDTSFSAKRDYVSWSRDTSIVCFLRFRKKEFYISVHRGKINEKGEKSKGFFTLDDPKKMAKDRSWTWKSGNTGHAYDIWLDDQENFNYIMFLLEQKYNSIG